MTLSIDALIHGYLDQTLSEEQWSQLQQHLSEDTVAAKRFVEISLLHDSMHHAFALSNISNADFSASNPQIIKRTVRNFVESMPGLRTGWSFAAVLILLISGFLWFSSTPSSASAVRELARLIEQVRGHDRTYEITVEQIVDSPQPRRSPPMAESMRPPKPPLDGAILHVRDRNQFVLIRPTSSGRSFVTGSDGITSWAVRPDGPVKVSSRLDEFNRDVPGHESGIPLTNLFHGLDNLKRDYYLQFSSLGPEEFQSNPSGSVHRLIVAIKKPNQRGPQRVEIVYESETGKLESLRFIQMPYGPQRLDLRLTPIDESPLADDFFEHQHHHSQDRPVEQED
jgi:hypothetical protein